MKPFLITFLLSALCGCLVAQTPADTIFIDESGKTVSRENASYYRFVQPEGNLYRVTDYFMDGTLQIKGVYSSLNPSKKEGYFTYYSKNGRLDSEGLYVNDKRDGIHKYYKQSEKGDSIWLWFIEPYKNGQANGQMIAYYENGNIKRKETLKDGELVRGRCYGENGEEIPYFPMKQMPEYVGGETALALFLQKNMRYPKDAIALGIEGKVYLGFIIDEEGNVTDIKIKRGIGAGCDQEALRVVKMMPPWKPGTMDGIPVKVQFNIPIEFALH